MKRLMLIVCFGLLLLFVTLNTAAVAEDTDNYSLWLGGHYTGFSDYNKKVGEYRLLSDNLFPEFRFSQFSQHGSSILSIDGHYFDDENVNGRVKAIVGDLFKGEFQYRSLTKQIGQDLLENMETRESIGGNPGGKMITHELTDPGADYRTHRQEITSKVSMLVSHKSNIRVIMAHRFIRDEGIDQSVASNHCFSCHLTSSTVKVDKRTHEIETGFEAEANNYDFGYLFGYRKFKSESSTPYAYYDDARHPVNGGAGAEFGSRMIFDDDILPYGILPETEKMSHKVNFKGNLGKGRFATAFFYSTIENSGLNYIGIKLESESFGGNLSYAVPVSKTIRLVAKASGKRVKNDDPFIDLPLFREARPDSAWIDFDYWRYSSLDRKEIDASAELINRINNKMILSVLAGYDYTMRYDYPEYESEYATKKMIGQLKINYREGLKYNIRGKYRFEKTTDPFTSGKGLFEAAGRGVLEPINDLTTFVFYFQREALRYQNITSVPTDRHEFDIRATIRANKKANLALGFKAVMDKNNDLDSLDVEHFSMKPNVNLTLMPSTVVTMSAGYTYDYNKSRGPVTVALFDG